HWVMSPVALPPLKVVHAVRGSVSFGNAVSEGMHELLKQYSIAGNRHSPRTTGSVGCPFEMPWKEAIASFWIVDVFMPTRPATTLFTVTLGVARTALGLMLVSLNTPLM